MTTERLLRVITELQPGDHLGFLYRTEAEHRALITPFIRQGLERNEKVLYLAHYFHPAETILDYLRDDGLDTEPYLASGQLSFQSSTEVYLQSGDFEPDKTIEFWRNEMAQALAEGYQALRGVGDLNWALEGLPGSERLLEFEAKLDAFLPGSQCLIICLYAWQHLDCEPLLTLLAAHPAAVIDSEVYTHFYDLPPADLQQRDLPTTILRYWLASQAERQQTAAALRESQHKLQAVFDHALDAMLLADDEGRYVDANPAACALLGYSRQELLERHIWDITPELELEAGRELWQAFIASGQQNGEYRLQRRNGTLLQIEYRAIANIIPGLHLSVSRDITERKAAEQTLRRREQQYRSLAENLPDIISRFDRQLRHLYVNRPVELITDIPAEDFLGKTWRELDIPPALVEQWEQVLRRVFETGQMETLEFTYPTPAGNRRYFETRLVPEKTAEGTVETVLGINRDITERKLFERELIIKDYAIESATNAIALTDLDAHITYVNARFLEMWGYQDKAQVLGKTPAYFLPSEAQAREIIETLRRQGRWLGEMVIKRQDGTLRDVQLSASMVTNAQGQPLSMMGSFIDITKRKRQDQELRTTKTLLQKTLDSLNEVVCIIDSKNRTIVTCNAAMERIFGYRPEELIGRNTAMLHLSQEMYEAFGRESEAVLAKGEVFNTEHQMRRKNGALIFTDHTIRPLWDEQGWPAGVVSVIRDITGRKQAEEAQRRYAERLRILREIDQAILAARSPAAIAYNTLRRIQELVPCVRASVVTLDAETDQTIFLAVQVAGETRLRPREKAPQQLFGPLRALRQGKIHTLPDIRQRSPQTPALETLKADGVRAYVNVPLISQGELIGVLNLGKAMPGPFAPEQLDIAREVADSLAVAIQQARLFETEQEARTRLQALSRQLLQVQEAERRHIARELHDQIGQILTGLKLMLDISSQSGDAHLVQARALVSELVERVNALSLDLRPPMLDDLGLLAALLWHIGRYTTQTGIQVKFQHYGLEGRRFQPEIETAAYRIVQEGLTNIVRHAGVGEAAVQLWASSERLTVHIEDYGAGFDVSDVLAPATSSGLSGMQERAALAGGQLTIESVRGRGTYLTAELPLRYPKERSAGDDNNRAGR